MEVEPYRSIIRMPSAPHEEAAPMPRRRDQEPLGPPRYLGATSVLPKGALQEYPNIDAETVRTAFSPNAMACGIRTLPNALRPDFRQRLMHEVLYRSKHYYSHGHGHPALAGTGCYASDPDTFFGVAPRKENPLNDAFGLYRYQTSPYDSAKEQARKYREAEAWRYGEGEFKVALPPQPLGAQSAFNGFTYHPEPYKKAVRDIVRSAGPDRAKQTADKAFMPAGSATILHLERTMDEVLNGLAAHFGRDWPRSFEQAFEDVGGGVVVVFNKDAVAAEGDITTYMNHWANHSDAVRRFRLFKDVVRWGVYDAARNWVGYMLWPQWVKHRPSLPEELLVPHKLRPLTSEFDVLKRPPLSLSGTQRPQTVPT